MAESGNESPTPSPPAEWLTYRAAGERLGMKPTAVAARARRGRWPRRIRNTDSAAEVEVPGALLAAGPQEPQEREEDAATGHEPIDVAAVIAAALAPLQAQLEHANAATAAAHAERRELQAQLTQIQERHAAGITANSSLRGEVAVERVKRESAEAATKDLRAQLDQAQARVDRLEADARKAAAEAEAKAKAKAAAPAKRPWWRWG